LAGTIGQWQDCLKCGVRTLKSTTLLDSFLRTKMANGSTLLHRSGSSMSSMLVSTFFSKSKEHAPKRRVADFLLSLSFLISSNETGPRICLGMNLALYEAMSLWCVNLRRRSKHLNLSNDSAYPPPVSSHSKTAPPSCPNMTSNGLRTRPLLFP